MTKNKRKWWILATVTLAVFMAMLDITIVNVALPEIQKSFTTDFATLQWVLNAYTLIYAVMLLPVSKLGDRYGRKVIFLSGLLIFVLGSLTSGLASSDLWLNLARGFQGIGGAAMMSLSLSIVTSSFPEAQRGLALGIWSSAVGLAVSIGPLVGGLLVDTLGWRSIFLINLPIGLFAMAMGYVFIEKQSTVHKEPLDYLGLVLSIVLIFSLLLALIQKETHSDYSWSHPAILGLFAASLAALCLFIFTERRAAYPLIDLSVFRSRSFVGANIAAFTLGAGLYGGFTYLSILMQNYMGFSAFETGVKLLLISIFTLILGPITGFISDKIGNRWLITVALMIGMVGMLSIRYLLDAPFQWAALFPGFILLGISNALVNPPISNAAMQAVTSEQVGMASGILNVFRQVGISFGVVILGISVTNGYTSHLNTGLTAISQLSADGLAQLRSLLQQAGPFAGEQLVDSPQVQSYQDLPIFTEIKTLVFDAFQHGMQQASIQIALFLLIGAVASLLLIKDKTKQS